MITYLVIAGVAFTGGVAFEVWRGWGAAVWAKLGPVISGGGGPDPTKPPK